MRLRQRDAVDRPGGRMQRVEMRRIGEDACDAREILDRVFRQIDDVAEDIVVGTLSVQHVVAVEVFGVGIAVVARAARTECTPLIQHDRGAELIGAERRLVKDRIARSDE